MALVNIKINGQTTQVEEGKTVVIRRNILC